MKSESIANLFERSGNELDDMSHYSAALIAYNKALCYAESDELKSILYGNRSLIYLKTDRFKMCIDNIQLAKKFGCPQDKLVHLQEIEDVCKRILDNGVDVNKKDDKTVAEFFKLSYESHPKIPFIIDAIELKTSEKYGNHLITNRDLKTGDIIAIEPLFACFGSLFSEYCYEKCAVCLRHNFYSLIPCDKCKHNLFIDMFCSELCKTQHNAIYHESACPEVKAVSSQVGIGEKRIEAAKRVMLTALKEFGNEEELFKLANDPVKLTIFDVDELSPKNILKIFFSLAQSENLKKAFTFGVSQICESESSSSMIPTQKDFKDLFIQVYTIYATNGMSVDRWNYDGTFGPTSGNSLKHRQVGETVGLFGSLFNHSCDPNIDCVTLDNKMVYFVNRPIKAGEQLFLSYGLTYISKPADERKKLLNKDFSFDCDCDACLNEHPLFDDLRKLNEVYETPILELSTVDLAIKTFKKNCELINELQHEHPCFETTNILGCNVMVMSHIAKDRL